MLNYKRPVTEVAFRAWLALCSRTHHKTHRCLDIARLFKFVLLIAMLQNVFFASEAVQTEWEHYSKPEVWRRSQGRG